MAKKFHIKRGDTVKVIAGNAKGKEGKIVKILVDVEKAIVQGLNIVTKHIKPSSTNPNGGIEKIEAPIHISNLMLIDPSNGNSTKIGRKLNENGKLQRFSKKTGEFIKDV